VSPYDYSNEAVKPFEQYGMEQQGQIVEDWFRGSSRAQQLITKLGVGPPRVQAHFHPDRRSSP